MEEAGNDTTRQQEEWREKKNESERKRRQKLAYTFRVNGRVGIYSHLCGLNAIRVTCTISQGR